MNVTSLLQTAVIYKFGIVYLLPTYENIYYMQPTLIIVTHASHYFEVEY